MTPNTPMTELSEKLDEMLLGLEGLPGGPWYYDVPDPGYTYDFVKTRHPDFAPTPQDRFRNQIAETDGATLETQKIGKHIARCDPDTMSQILTLAKQALSQSLRAPAGEAEWTRHRDNTFDLDKSFDHPGESHSRAGRNLYNIIDWTGQHRGQIALTHDEYQAVNPIRPLSSPPSEGVKVTDAARDVMAERQRQIEAEGWTPAHDDAHDRGEMAAAAGCYALGARLQTHEVDGPGSYVIPEHWPWDGEWWKPGLRRRDLVKAAALLLAEIERLDRLAAQSQEPK